MCVWMHVYLHTHTHKYKIFLCHFHTQYHSHSTAGTELFMGLHFTDLKWDLGPTFLAVCFSSLWIMPATESSPFSPLYMDHN